MALSKAEADSQRYVHLRHNILSAFLSLFSPFPLSSKLGRVPTLHVGIVGHILSVCNDRETSIWKNKSNTLEFHLDWTKINGDN